MVKACCISGMAVGGMTTYKVGETGGGALCATCRRRINGMDRSSPRGLSLPVLISTTIRATAGWAISRLYVNAATLSTTGRSTVDVAGRPCDQGKQSAIYLRADKLRATPS